MRERTRVDRQLTEFRAIEQEFADNLELLELAEAEDDADTIAEVEKALIALRAVTAKKQLESLLSGEADANNCFVEIHAGAGGTESQDWAEMLMRMYARWADDHDFKLEWLEESPGEEAGIKSATVRVIGDNAYGWLKTESGVHRLVRISPFDSAAGARGPVGIDPQVRIVDLDLDRVVYLGIDPGRGEAGVAPGGRIEG